MNVPRNAGLPLLREDGTINRGLLQCMARSRAVIHSRKYLDDMAAAYRIELANLMREAHDQHTIYQMRVDLDVLSRRINARLAGGDRSQLPPAGEAPTTLGDMIAGLVLIPGGMLALGYGSAIAHFLASQ